jgi:two-component sensor histidine kinase
MDGFLPVMTAKPDSVDQLVFRQLTHQTKNSMQRIMNELSRSSANSNSAEWKRLIGDLQWRILLSARLPDLLFGEIAEADTLEDRLRSMGVTVIELLGDVDQVIDLRVSVSGVVPRPFYATLLRLTHEIVGNAVKHGMRERIAGRIWIDIESGTDLALSVKNDGWALCADHDPGEGMALMRHLADSVGGRISIERVQEITCVRLICMKNGLVGCGADGGNAFDIAR